MWVGSENTSEPLRESNGFNQSKEYQRIKMITSMMTETWNQAKVYAFISSTLFEFHLLWIITIKLVLKVTKQCLYVNETNIGLLINFSTPYNPATSAVFFVFFLVGGLFFFVLFVCLFCLFVCLFGLASNENSINLIFFLFLFICLSYNKP